MVFVLPPAPPATESFFRPGGGIPETGAPSFSVLKTGSVASPIEPSCVKGNAMKRTALLAVVLLAAACTASNEAATTSTEAATTTTTTTTPATTTTTPATTTPPPATTTTTPTLPPTTVTTEIDVDEVRADFVDMIRRGLEADTGELGEFERVDVIHMDGEGTLEIEGHLVWSSKDRQPESNWESIAFLSLFAEVLEATPVNLFGGEPMIHIITVSTDGDHRYESLTDWETLTGVADRLIGFDGWVERSDAGFRN